ncbi:DinB family protein [Flavobacterium sp. ZS1P14]|uniref:DinB family protein n=1 Tax=Flavobacterium sp. ZS1P14 TaxID=3401729 RepID=UPI003AAFB975
MAPIEIILVNFEEIRRRSIKIWLGISPEHYFWSPDTNAMNCIEMVRHVLEGEHLFHMIVNNRGNIGNYISPWTNRPYLNIQEELDFAKTFREKFLATIENFEPYDLTSIEIVRSEKSQKRKLGDYLQRIAYHEAVHAGQMLYYMRTFGIERPLIWD